MEQQALTKSSEAKTSDVSRPSAQPASSFEVSVDPLSHLQKALGNRGLGRFIQAKLEVSQPDDVHEQEADRVADEVMAGNQSTIGISSHGVQRKIYRQEFRDENLVDSVPMFGEASPEPVEEVQRSASGAADTPTARFEQSLEHSHNGGQPLSPSTQSMMESRFGWDFSSVRVHNDARAHSLAREVNARAFTLDNDIYFSSSAYQPESAAGQHLLAHELTHVVQQSQGRVSRKIHRATACNSYGGYQMANDIATYNCAGLATRTYQDISPASAAVDAIAANFNTPQSPSGGACAAGDVKFWLWEYEMHLEDDQNTVVSPTHRDFHVVAGRVDSAGNDPADVYSKNGHRPVYGPGTGPSFRPATRERATSNDAAETPATRNGRPLFKVRSGMTESISCGGCD